MTLDVNAIPHAQRPYVKLLQKRLAWLQEALPFQGRTLRKIKEHLKHCHPNAMGYCQCPDEEDVVEADANLVCSDVRGSKDPTGFMPTPMHKPVIDIDFPCRLVESSEGKFHLYIDKEVGDAPYWSMLMSMVRAGIVEDGYYNASKNRGYSAVRHPDRLKNPPIKLDELLELM